MRAPRLRVYGGITITALVPSANGNRQARTIVCAKNKKEAVRLLCSVPNGRCHMSYYYFNGYWCETNNTEEIAVANHPGVWTSQVVTGDPQWKCLLGES